MPLESGKSKAAFSHNVATEMKAGKEQKQAVAIAYAKQRGDADAAVAKCDAVIARADDLSARIDSFLKSRRDADLVPNHDYLETLRIGAMARQR